MIEKLTLIKETQINPKDTGSARVQVVLVQYKILMIKKHLSIHKEDRDAIRSLFRFMQKKKDLLRQIIFYNRIEHDSLVLKLTNLEKN